MSPRKINNHSEVVTFKDVARVLFERSTAAGIPAQDIAGKLCPRLNSVNKSGGGPGRGDVKISYILGRMAKRGWVGSRCPAIGPRGWFLTLEGYAHFSETETPI